MNSAEKARLSDAQKKANHIESEKKRREAIREGFDRLADIVPGMKGQGRSESVVLQATVEFAREQIRKKEGLRKIALSKGFTDAEFERAYANAQGDNKSQQGTPNGQSPATRNGGGAVKSKGIEPET